VPGVHILSVENGGKLSGGSSRNLEPLWGAYSWWGGKGLPRTASAMSTHGDRDWSCKLVAYWREWVILSFAKTRV